MVHHSVLSQVRGEGVKRFLNLPKEHINVSTNDSLAFLGAVIVFGYLGVFLAHGSFKIHHLRQNTMWT